MNHGIAALAAAALLAAGTAFAQPFIDRDNGPFTGTFGFPDSREGSRLAPAGTNEWGFFLATASHSLRDGAGTESILIDGETTRASVSWRRGVGSSLELGIGIPWVWHESGNLDTFIDGWHRFFGLPDGIRGQRPRNRLLFEYASDGGDLLQLNRRADGIGDIRVFGGWQLATTPRGSQALRFGIKLPSGDSGKLLGSGGTDVSIGLAGDRFALAGLDSLDAFYRINATWLGHADFLPAGQRRVVGQLSAGLGLHVSRRTSLAAQGLLRSPIYDSSVSPLGDTAAALTVGLHFQLSENHRISFAVTEDLRPESMPDVTFLLSVESRRRE